MTDLSSAGVSKYHRVANALRREIQEGVYGPGDQLPSEAQLVERFGVSQPTVRAAVRVLRAEGIVESVHGRGTFVRRSRRLQRVSRQRYGRARGDQELLTSHLRHEITFVGRVSAPESVAELMGLEPGTEVVVRRRTLHDPESDQPVELGASYLPLEVAADTYLEEPEVVPKALFLCVEELTGRTYARAQDRFVTRMPSIDEAAALGIGPGTPVLHVVHAAHDERGDVLEVSESVWPGDKVMVVDEYDIPSEPQEPDAPSDV